MRSPGDLHDAGGGRKRGGPEAALGEWGFRMTWLEDEVMEHSVEWLTLAEVSSRTGLRETEVQRRIGEFEQYLCGRNFGDIVKYPPQTAQLVLAVTNLYRLGWETGDIAELLETTFHEVREGAYRREINRSRNTLVALKALFEKLEHYHRKLETMHGCVQQLATVAEGAAEPVENGLGQGRVPSRESRG